MIAGGDKCYVGKIFTEWEKEYPQNCVRELEQRTGQPHQVEVKHGQVNRDIFSYEVIAVKDPSCKANGVYDGYVGSNKDDAQACAKELQRITGQKYDAKRIAQRTIFAHVYKVVASR